MTRYTGIQSAVRQNLEAYTQSAPRRRITNDQMQKLLRALPGFIRSLPMQRPPSHRRLPLPSGAKYGRDPGISSIPRSEGLRVMLLPAAATGQELLALGRIINKVSNFVVAMGPRKTAKIEIEDALRLLQSAYSKLGARLSLVVEENRGGNQLDEHRKSLLEGLAQLFVRLELPLTTTPDGPFVVTARTLLGVKAIHHTDLKSAKDKAAKA